MIKDTVYSLVDKGELADALDLLIQNGSNDAISLKSQLSSIKRNKNIGVFSPNEASAKLDKIADDIRKLADLSIQSIAVPLSRDFFKSKGFKEFPHLTVGNGLFLELSRNRAVFANSLETPNETLFIVQINDENERQIDDLVCIHNYDYDGYLTERKLNALLIFFS